MPKRACVEKSRSVQASLVLVVADEAAREAMPPDKCRVAVCLLVQTSDGEVLRGRRHIGEVSRPGQVWGEDVRILDPIRLGGMPISQAGFCGLVIAGGPPHGGPIELG